MLNQTAAAQPDLSSAELEKMEKEMDLFPRSVLGAEGMKKVEDGLFKSLGLRALGAQPRVVAKKVLKRGRVASEEERSILHDYLSEDSSRHELSQKEAKILDGILGKP